MDFVSRSVAAAIAAAFLLAAAGAGAQERQEKDGLVLYWGLVPGAVAAQRLPVEEMHGGKPIGGGKVHHLVLAVFESKSGARVSDAVVRAQVSESGIVQEPAKYVPAMAGGGAGSYGQLFGMVHEGPYRFTVWVKHPSRRDDVRFDIVAAPQLDGSH